MRVTILNLNLEGHDAIGQCIVNQARFFLRRGDQVQICLMDPSRNVPDSIKGISSAAGVDKAANAAGAAPPPSDLYIYHYPGRYGLLESIRSLDRGAVVFYYHNVTPPDIWGSPFLREQLRDSVESVGEYARYADLIVTDSPFNAEQLTNDYGLDPHQIRVLPLGVDLANFCPRPKPDAFLQRYGLHGRRVILYVGRMAGNKRIDLLVEALARVRQELPNAALLLVGDDRGNPAIQDAVAEARSRAAELGVTAHVIFAGMVDDLSLYYNLADVYASASEHEGFGVPLLEAMASGVPIVASKATAHPWTVGDAGLLAEAGNASDMAEKLVQVLTDEVLCGDLVQRGLERAREFSLECYDAGWAKIVSEATAWLPNHPYPRLRPMHLRLGEQQPPTGATVHGETLDGLRESADIMLRNYVVRSGVPVLGQLIVWVRRNLTSHLREPYLDPTLERQVALNHRLVRTLESLSTRVKGSEAQQARMEKRLELLSAQVALAEIRAEQSSDSGHLAELTQRIEDLRRDLQEGSLSPSKET